MVIAMWYDLILGPRILCLLEVVGVYLSACMMYNNTWGFPNRMVGISICQREKSKGKKQRNLSLEVPYLLGPNIKHWQVPSH